MGASRATILVVDDVLTNIMVLEEVLGEEYVVRSANNGPDALMAAREGVDVILLDVMMPDMDGYEVCRRLKADERTRDIPVIFVTACGDVENEAHGLALGAVDYITKPFNAPIVKARVRTHVELKTKNDLLARTAQIDGLTGIANRRHFDEVLSREWQRCLRATSWLSLIMIDIDHFKQYNDHYGHPAGDHCLRRVTTCLVENALRVSDLVARYGGEEFAMLLPATDLQGAYSVALRAHQAVLDLAIEHSASPAARVVTISLGLASMVPTPTVDQEELIVAADQQLYEAKSQGRNRIQS